LKDVFTRLHEYQGSFQILTIRLRRVTVFGATVMMATDNHCVEFFENLSYS
jgi:hypothetical protein